MLRLVRRLPLRLPALVVGVLLLLAPGERRCVLDGALLVLAFSRPCGVALRLARRLLYRPPPVVPSGVLCRLLPPAVFCEALLLVLLLLLLLAKLSRHGRSLWELGTRCPTRPLLAPILLATRLMLFRSGEDRLALAFALVLPLAIEDVIPCSGDVVAV